MSDNSYYTELAALRTLSSTELARRPEALVAIARGLVDTRAEASELATDLLETLVLRHRLRPQHTQAGFPEDAEAALITALHRAASPRARQLAARALCEAERISSMGALVASLADPDPGVRAASIQGLHRWSWAPAQAPVLTRLLAHPEPHVRSAALQALPGHVDRQLLAALAPALHACLADPARDVRIRAACLLEAVETPGQVLDQVFGLVPAQAGGQIPNQADIPRSRSIIPSRLPVHIWPVLLEAVQHGSSMERTSALRRFEALGATGAIYIEPLLATASDSDPAVCGHALTALACIAPGDTRVLAALVAALGDSRLEPRTAAIHALGRSASPDAIPLVADFLDRALDAAMGDSPDPAQLAALEALGRMGAHARAAYPVIARALTHPGVELCLAAVMACAAMELDTPELRAAVQTLRAHGDAWIQEVAANITADLDARSQP